MHYLQKSLSLVKLQKRQRNDAGNVASYLLHHGLKKIIDASYTQNEKLIQLVK